MLYAACAVAQGEQAENNSRLIRSAYHPVQARYYDNLLPEADIQSGGAIERLGDGYLGVTGAGAFFQIIWDGDSDAVTAHKLPLKSPHNAAVFDAIADPLVNRAFFRVIDIVSRETDSGWQLFASHHRWLEDRECLVLRISSINIDNNFNPLDSDWNTVYETTPCLTLVEGNRGRIFVGHEAGGRMGWLDDDSLLFTTGDLEHDGWHQPIAMAQSDDHMYGKVILVDVDQRTGSLYSKGHRNPQGLYIDDEGNIWETEHGPRGGDEINLIVQGANYGWPWATYGTDYGRFAWPPAANAVGDHSGYEQPVYAFVPSVGISNLIRLGETQFSGWQGDLLVSSLGSRSLYRLALNGNRVLYSEPMLIERRIRDLTTGPDGQIWLWGESGDLVSLSVADTQDRGAALFQPCSACHTTSVSSGGLAPTLIGIVGRRMASRTDYNYSESFRSLDGTWTEELLDEFLADPNSFAPGTTMSETRVDNAEDRRLIIEYLRDTAFTF